MNNEPTLTADNLKTGYKFPSQSIDITKDMIRNYAETSFDLNPLHLDDKWMETASFGKTQYNNIIAHGLMTYSFVARMITDVVYPSGGWHERCEMRFKSPVNPGDTITTHGVVSNIRSEDGYILYEADVTAKNQDGIACEIGTAIGRIPADSSNFSDQESR